MVVSVLLIVILLPVLLAISGLVAWGGGPVLYGHKRIGRGSRPFHCLKFRTMAVDAEARLADMLSADPAARAEWAADFKLRFE